MRDNPSKFFDDILKLLSTDYNRIFKLEEIHKHLFPEDFNYSEEPFEILVLENTNESDIRNALMFLNKQSLIAANFETDQFLINTAGFVKIRTQGFEEEIREKETNLKLQRWTWKVLPNAAIATAVFTGLTFILALLKFLL